MEALAPRYVVAGYKNERLDDAARSIAETRRHLDTAEDLLERPDSAPGFFDAMLERFPERFEPRSALGRRGRPLPVTTTGRSDLTTEVPSHQIAFGVVALQLNGRMARPERTEFGDACPIERSVTLLGRRSTILLLREASYGTSRFDDFVRRTGLTESVTADQLRKLVAEDLLAKHPYQEPAQRQRSEYVLTEAGHDLLPILLALGAWGDKHRPRPHRVRMVHADCGAAINVEVRCEAGHLASESEVAVVLEDRQAT